MLRFPSRFCYKVGNFCLCLVSQTLYTAVFVINTASEISQRLYCITKLDKDRREQLFAVSKEQLEMYSRKRFRSCDSAASLQGKDENDDEVSNLKLEEDLEEDEVYYHGSHERSCESKFLGLREVNSLKQDDVDEEITPLVSSRSTMSSQTQTGYEEEIAPFSQFSFASSEYSELVQKKSRFNVEIQNQVSVERWSFKKSTSFFSSIAEDETQDYIEDLQFQVSELMEQASQVQHLQQRVQELEAQRDLLTRELLEMPKYLLAENDNLKSQLNHLQTSRQQIDDKPNSHVILN